MLLEKRKYISKIQACGAGSGSGSTGTAASMGRNANSLRLDQRSIHFSANAWVYKTFSILTFSPV